MERKAFILILLTVTTGAARWSAPAHAQMPAGETLYNGIRLSLPWPPHREGFTPDPATPHYLA